MLTLNEFLELREKLENNEVSIEFVKKKLQLHWDKLKDGKRSWQTKDISPEIGRGAIRAGFCTRTGRM